MAVGELSRLAAERGLACELRGAGQGSVTGVCMDSRAVQVGDLYAAVPGANRHGADFVAAAAAAGATAILTDDDGAARARATGLDLLVVPSVREAVGVLAGLLYGTDAAGAPELFGVTGTNGKTTTTYLITSLLRALGQKTGMIGTIEIVAGDTRIPSVLTTPEAPQLHALLARMREAGVGATAMEVSSHSIDYHRVGGLHFAVSGFTNLTQDHLDLHGGMEEYYAAKARLFTRGRSARAVVTVDDEWGRRLAAEAGAEVWTLATGTSPGTTSDAAPPGPGGHGTGHNGTGHHESERHGSSHLGGDPHGIGHHWRVRGIAASGLGNGFELHGPAGEVLRARTGLPGLFNVANAALALLMVHASGVGLPELQAALDDADPLTVAVPGRMQIVCEAPAAVVDFAHNPDALERAIDAVRGTGEGSRTIVVFGATGQRDVTKRPIMGAIAARHADVVIVTDDDPHDEDPAGIRAQVLRGALEAIEREGLASSARESHPRARAIAEAAAMAGPRDTILVAGRGHEVWQEVRGTNLALDDRVELRNALAAAGFAVVRDPGDSTDTPANG
jgi:UDP-N-acetylmuramoyl-L-alanyl-D-glutamate--2,6-diaminopimelate ligase